MPFPVSHLGDNAPTASKDLMVPVVPPSSALLKHLGTIAVIGVITFILCRMLDRAHNS